MSREAKLLSREFQNKHPRLREHWACFRGSSKPGGVRLCRAAVMHNSLRGQLLISIKPSPTTTPFFHTDLEDYRKEGNENLNFFHYLDTIMALLVCFVLPPTASILIRCKIYLYVTRSRENIVIYVWKYRFGKNTKCFLRRFVTGCMDILYTIYRLVLTILI